jgi:hypothetical protein
VVFSKERSRKEEEKKKESNNRSQLEDSFT